MDLVIHYNNDYSCGRKQLNYIYRIGRLCEHKLAPCNPLKKFISFIKI